jgi:hypothetical protein
MFIRTRRLKRPGHPPSEEVQRKRVIGHEEIEEGIDFQKKFIGLQRLVRAEIP